MLNSQHLLMHQSFNLLTPLPMGIICGAMSFRLSPQCRESTGVVNFCQNSDFTFTQFLSFHCPRGVGGKKLGSYYPVVLAVLFPMGGGAGDSGYY